MGAKLSAEALQYYWYCTTEEIPYMGASPLSVQYCRIDGD